MPGLLVNKFHDLNGNGQRDTGEPGLDGWAFESERYQFSSPAANLEVSLPMVGLLGWADALIHMTTARSGVWILRRKAGGRHPRPRLRSP
ncbi:MAG: hypothetical protein IPK16_32820 [Anaerolineales bacterium]|nr:hypothetical protein [Anaerolineales bacterium]